jgi:hypothetical protein
MASKNSFISLARISVYFSLFSQSVKQLQKKNAISTSFESIRFLTASLRIQHSNSESLPAGYQFTLTLIVPRPDFVFWPFFEPKLI